MLFWIFPIAYVALASYVGLPWYQIIGLGAVLYPWMRARGFTTGAQVTVNRFCAVAEEALAKKRKEELSK